MMHPDIALQLANERRRDLLEEAARARRARLFARESKNRTRRPSNRGRGE